MGRHKINHDELIIEYQLRLTTSQLKTYLNRLSKDNNTISDTISIQDKRNTKSMDNISINATLNSDTDITLTLNWTDDNKPYTQTLKVFKHTYSIRNQIKNRYYYEIEGDTKRYQNIYYNEHQFKTDKQFNCRIEDRYLTTKERNMRIIANPKKYYGSRKTYTHRAKAYLRYQRIYNEFLIQMYNLSTSDEKSQLDKFIEWSETLKESIKNMK